MKYMRELGFRYKPSLSKTGKHVFLRKKDGRLTKPASWAHYAEAVQKHPRYEEIHRKFRRHGFIRRSARNSPSRYRQLVEAGIIHPAEGRRLERRASHEAR